MTNSERRSPYQGLVPFEEKDAPFFFGRERDTRLIIANLFAAQLTLLYGASGVGKSSILRAGALHQLKRREDLLVIAFNSWQGDPLSGLRSRIAETALLTTNQNFPIDQSEPLVDFLSRCSTNLDRRLIVLLDQFEEYFLYSSKEDAFAAEFATATTRRDVPVSFLISIREDSLAKLDRFEGYIPSLFDNLLRLDHLDRPAATDAILKPVEQYNKTLAAEGNHVSFDPALVDKVIEQIRTGEVFVGEAGRGQIAQSEQTEVRVETPYLQMVMERIWDEELRLGSQVLRAETLDRLGGADRIVRTHLDAAMGTLSWSQQDIAAQVFHYLVTPSGTKIAHSVPDLAEYAKLRQDQIAPVLSKLSAADTRILRPIAPLPGQSEILRYEIFHDVLAPAILDWRTRRLHPQQQRSYRRDKFLIVCGGTGKTLLGQRRALGMDADLHIDVRSELGSLTDMHSFRLGLDEAVSTLPQLLQDMKGRISQDEKPSASKKHIEFLADHLQGNISLRNGVARSPAIAGGLIRYERNANLLKEHLSNMIAQAADRTTAENPMEFWIISSTAGGVGEGTHRFLADTLSQIISQSPRFAKLNFIRIGSMTYRSIDVERTGLNTFFGVAADAALAAKLRRDYPSISANWFYLDLPDTGRGMQAKPVRDRLIEMAVKTIMLDDLAPSLQSLVVNDGTALVRIGYWGREWNENALFFSTLKELIRKLEFLVQPESKILLRDKESPRFQPGRKLSEVRKDLGNEKKLATKLIEGWKFPKLQQTSSEEVMLKSWETVIDGLIHPQRIADISSQSQFEVETPTESAATMEGNDTLNVPASLTWMLDDWFEAIARSQQVKAWADQLLGSEAEHRRGDLKEKLYKLAQECSSTLYKFPNQLDSPPGKAHRLARILPDFVEALAQVIHLSELERRAEQLLETQLTDARSLLAECIRQERSAKIALSGIDEAPVIAAELSDKIDPLQNEPWLRLLTQAFEQGGAGALRHEVLRGAIGLTRDGLLQVLDLRPMADREVVKPELRQRMGRMLLGNSEYEAQFWAAIYPPAIKNRYSFRIFPRLEPGLMSELGTNDDEIQYLYASRGELGLYVVAFEGVSIAEPFDTTETPAYLLRSFVDILKDVLHRSDGPIVAGRPHGKIDIAGAGVVGEPLYKYALQVAGLTREELERLAEFYSFYDPVQTT